MPVRFSLIACVVLVGVSPTAADDTLYRYEGDVVPYDESAGWAIFNPCEDECSESLENGHFVLHWSAPGDLANYDRVIAGAGDPSTPATLWVEWRFRSNHPLGPNFFNCDGRFAFQYEELFDLVNMYGDAVIIQSGGFGIFDLDINDFHTFRFESVDGRFYRVTVDGQPFTTSVGTKNPGGAFIQMGGRGSCSGHLNTINEWDFVRYGTIDTGELIIASDPPHGVLDPELFPNLDRFTVTFDSANYVYVDDIAVEASGGIRPNVIQTRRRENTDPDTVEVVLDRGMPVGQTTTFSFHEDGNIIPTNVIAFTLVLPTCGDGSVNQPEEQCDGPDDSTCPGLCRADCICGFCGDGIQDPGEQCDGQEDAACPDNCRVDCICGVCGDGIVDNTEACDDGSSNSDATPDACRTDCTLPRCGDGVTDAGEGCDNGPANSDTLPDACRTDCTPAACGDNVTDTAEECDGPDDGACPGECEADCSCHVPGIPAVSHWGLLAMTVLLLLFSKRYFGRIAVR